MNNFYSFIIKYVRIWRFKMNNTQIKEVAIYRDGALVKREGKVSLETGSRNVTLCDLPFNIDPSTIRLSLPKGIKGSNVQVKKLTNEEKTERNRELQKQLAEIENQFSILTSQKELWCTNGDFTGNKNLDISQMSEYIDKLPERLERLYQKESELLLKKEELTKKLEEQNKANSRNYVTADIYTTQEGEYPFELRYLQRNVSWYPFYEVHSSSEEARLSLLLKAKIRQQSGEDWENCEVKLFTSNPSVSLDIPELPVQNITYHVPNRNLFKAAGRASNDMAMGMRMAESMAMVADEEVEPVEMEEVSFDTAEYVQSDTMNEYALPGTYNISKDNETTLNVSAKEVDCEYHEIAVPKKDTCAYLAAEVNSDDIAELSDTATLIYHDDTYLGQACLNIDKTKDKYDISLGRDENVHLEKKELLNKTSDNFIKTQKTTEHDYEITIKSNKNKDVRIRMADQLPLSHQKDITVTAKELSGGKLDENTNKVTWEFDLAPKETKTFRLSYSVSWPKDKNITY